MDDILKLKVINIKGTRLLQGSSLCKCGGEQLSCDNVVIKVKGVWVNTQWAITNHPSLDK